MKTFDSIVRFKSTSDCSQLLASYKFMHSLVDPVVGAHKTASLARVALAFVRSFARFFIHATAVHNDGQPSSATHLMASRLVAWFVHLARPIVDCRLDSELGLTCVQLARLADCLASAVFVWDKQNTNGRRRMVCEAQRRMCSQLVSEVRLMWIAHERPYEAGAKVTGKQLGRTQSVLGYPPEPSAGGGQVRSSWSEYGQTTGDAHWQQMSSKMSGTHWRPI